MNTINSTGLPAVFAAFLTMTLTAAVPRAEAQTGPPFKSGEVVVTGTVGELAEEFRVVKYLPNADLTVLAVERGREWGVVQRLRERGRRAGLNLIAKASMEVNDPYNSYQWNFGAVQAYSAWDLTAASGVTVAILDTGLREGGQDGIGCIVPGWDAVNLDFDPGDGDGHGTHVSGTVAQATNNSTGVAGLAHGSCVMPVKVLDDTGSGSFADIADGLTWAVNNGAQVVNMSLGTDARFRIESDPFMDTALDYAHANDVTVVASSGNDGSRNNVSYPAIYPTTIAVGATDYSDAVTGYSNRGSGLDLVAPGGDLSRDLNGDGYGDGVLQETYHDAWGYYFYHGTSMASPHVAAAAAMLVSTGVADTPDMIYQALTATARDIGDPGYDTESGYGLLQTFDALNYGASSCTDSDGDGWCVEDGDCNDSSPAVYPGATEVCDGIDNDCDSLTDDDDPSVAGQSIWFADSDADTFGDSTFSQMACTQPAGFVSNGSDCDDNDPAVNPGTTETCDDGIDNDCNGLTDTDDPSCFSEPACQDHSSKSACNNDPFCEWLGNPRTGSCQSAAGCTATEDPEASCADGLDNDCDGLSDSADPDCGGGPAGPEICNDGVDNDGDRKIDCADKKDCRRDPACQ